MQDKNIYKFINSIEIREYLKSIDYQFNALEAVSIINDAYNFSLIERIKEYKEVRKKYKDCKYIDVNGRKWENIHKTINDYINAINEFITSLFLDKGYIFSYACLDLNVKDSDVGSSKNIFRSFNDALEYIKNNEAKHLLIWINRYKTIEDMTNLISDKIYVNSNYEIANIEQNKDIDSLLNNNPFNGGNVNVPLPFNKGDIICDSCYPFETYKFIEKIKNGIKVINNGVEDIIENYLSLGYYDKNIAINKIMNYYKMKKKKI